MASLSDAKVAGKEDAPLQAGEESPDWFHNETTPTESKQQFRYALVLDFEATCFEAGGIKLKAPQEIIEFPVVIIDLLTPQGEAVAEFHRYVRPTEIPMLSQFCTELTGITQDMVDGQATIDIVLREFVAWVEAQPFLVKGNGVDSTSNFVLCTCGDWDLKTMFPTEIKRKGLTALVPAWLRGGWCNVKAHFEAVTGTRAKGMPGMLNFLRLPLIGRHHSGIDDTRNIARILQRLVCEWGDAVPITKMPHPAAWA